MFNIDLLGQWGIFTVIITGIVSYLIGSIPSGLLIGKIFYGKDIRKYGSRNIGATNAYRILGLPAAIAVFLCDALKGIVGVWLFHNDITYMVLGGLIAILGHNCSIFLGFKGGRGVATALGVLIYLAPLISLICFITWGIIVYFTKYVSLGSVVGAALVPILMFVFNEPMVVNIFGLVASLFVIYRHKDNIMRLIQGKELKVERTDKTVE